VKKFGSPPLPGLSSLAGRRGRRVAAELFHSFFARVGRRLAYVSFHSVLEVSEQVRMFSSKRKRFSIRRWGKKKPLLICHAGRKPLRGLDQNSGSAHVINRQPLWGLLAMIEHAKHRLHAAAWTGKSTRKVVPLPTSLSTSMRPWWASTIILHWNMPMPMPFFLVVWKGRNKEF